MKDKTLAQREKESVTILKCYLTSNLPTTLNVDDYFLITKLDDILDYFNKL